MRTNVEKVLERDQKLSELDDRAGQPTASRAFTLCVSVCLSGRLSVRLSVRPICSRLLR